ncbi:MAG: hypothetical protein OHK93_008301 [Ramalina farinacea]|uniref:tRNA (32-2'-O)-methyltransferase regulator THADA-like TPR repeats region domain-containing protein n=1 Tax=Ramalina farinacea TaxID=258253 RepID=A0AA43QNX3_9LECA|nr:hypothetical protein [Ramalina farinacea]
MAALVVREHADHNGGLTTLSESELREVSTSLSNLLPGPKTSVVETQLDDGSIDSLQKVLERLFFTADSTTLTISHGAAALGALSGFLDRCSIASDDNVKTIVLNEDTLKQILRIYLFRAENHKPKPLRRLLITCGLLINRLPNKDSRLRVVEEVVKSCVQAICEPELIVAIKSAIQLLEHLLSKQIIDATLILDKASPHIVESTRELSDIEDGDNVQSFAVKILEWVQYPDCAPAISHLLPVFFSSVKISRKANVADEIIPRVGESSLWMKSVRQFMKIHPESFSVLEEHILPALLAHDKEAIGDYIHSLTPFRENDPLRESNDMDDILLCLLACRTASKLGSTHVNTLGLSRAGSSEYSINPTSLSLSLLDHASPSVRLNALTTLVSLVKPAEEFENSIVVRLKECIPYFLLETSSKPRNELIAVMKKFSSSIRMAVPALTGKASEYERSDAAEFLLWYLRFLVQELRPTAPYQTHITALNLMLGFIQSFARDICVNNILRLITPNSEQYKMLFSQLSRVLLDLLFNAFDDVRHFSAEILELLVESEFHARSDTISAGSKVTDREEATLTIIDQILDCVPRAKDLFYQTVRADHADGLGRLLNLAFVSRQCSSNLYDQTAMYHDLVYELQKGIDEAVKDLDHAVRTAPLHGHLIALRYIQKYSMVESMLKLIS